MRVKNFCISTTILAFITIIAFLVCYDGKETLAQSQTASPRQPIPETKLVLPEYYGFYAVNVGETVELKKEGMFPLNLNANVEFIMFNKRVGVTASISENWKIHRFSFNTEANNWTALSDDVVECRTKSVKDQLEMMRIIPVKTLEPGFYLLNWNSELWIRFFVDFDRLMNSFVEAAREAMKQERWDDVVTETRKALAFKPDDAEMNELLRTAKEEVMNLQSDSRYFGMFHTILWTTTDENQVHAVSFSPDGKTIVAGGYAGVKLWDVETGTLKRHFSLDISSSIAFSSDSKIIAGGGYDGRIKLWDVETGKELRTLSGHQADVKAIAFSSDSKIIAGGGYDGRIKLWDVETGKELRTLSGHQDDVNSVAFSPDGKIIVSGSQDHTVKLWDVETGKELRTLSGHQANVNAVAFSPDGKTIVSGGFKAIKLWNVETGRELWSHSGPQASVNSVAFSPDGKIIVSGGFKAIKLWDVETGKELRTFSEHQDVVSSVVFSPDGKTIVSGSWDKTIKLWGVKD
jgi:WD40 repeat protein